MVKSHAIMHKYELKLKKENYIIYLIYALDVT